MRPSLFVSLLALALVPRFAAAQGGMAGSLTGYVLDQNGYPVHGVKVTAFSGTQIGGSKVAYSNDEGSFRIIGLSPGKFDVTAQAPKLRSVVQKGVDVGITAATEVTFVMEVQTAVEEVVIMEKAPVVSTTKANIKETYSVELVESMPFDGMLDKFKALVNQTPGTINGRVRGGGVSQTLFTQDGFEMRDQFPSLRSSAAFEIQTGGYGADAPTAAGGVSNLVTKSGSNKVEFELSASGEARQLEFFEDNTDPKASRYRYLINPTIGGPIIKDRLWYHLNSETWINQETQDRDPSGIIPEPVPFRSIIHKATLKLTWQVTSRNKVELLSNVDVPYQRNRRRDANVAPEAQEDRLAQRWFGGLSWQSALTDALLFRSQVGYVAFLQHIYPVMCRADPENCDYVPAIRQKFPQTYDFGNNGQHQSNDLRSVQFNNRLEWFKDGFLGSHNIQLKQNLLTELDTTRLSHPGEQLDELNGPVPERRTTYYSNDPRLEPARQGWYISSTDTVKNVVTLADAWQPTRYLTLTPALSYVWARGGNNYGGETINAVAWAPALSGAWNATHDGRTVVRGSVSSYVDVEVAPLARFTIGEQTKQTCNYTPATGGFETNCVFSGGRSRNTVGSPCGPTGLTPDGQSCLETLKIPRTWEYTAGAEHEVVPGVGLGIDVVYRRFVNQYEDRETNRLWDSSGSTVVGYRNGRNGTVMDLGTPSSAYRRYLGVSATLAKREGRLKVQSSYTWSRLNGSVLDGFRNAFGDIPPRDAMLDGPLSDDHRHEVKLSAQYQVSPWLSAGVRYFYYTGVPYSRLFYNSETGKFDDYRARVGIDPGVAINDPKDDRQLRLPDLQSLNAQLRLSMAPLIGHRVQVVAEVLNMLAMRTPTRLGQDSGSNFGAILQRAEPFRIRLGFEYKY
jgi:hypothetical protein